MSKRKGVVITARVHPGESVGSWMMKGALNKDAAKNLKDTRIQLIKDTANKSDFLPDCLNVPKHALYAPIAQDYERFNASPNFGEVIGARM